MNGDGMPFRLRRLDSAQLLAESKAEESGIDAAVKEIVAEVRKRSGGDY